MFRIQEAGKLIQFIKKILERSSERDCVKKGDDDKKRKKYTLSGKNSKMVLVNLKFI